MEVKKVDVLDALNHLKAYGGEGWVSVEDLVKLTNLSEKWVRESLERLQAADLVSVMVMSRGVRLYALKRPIEALTTVTPDSLTPEQTVILKRSATSQGRKPVQIGSSSQKVREWTPPPPIPVLTELFKRRKEIREILQATDIDQLSSIFEELKVKRESQRGGNPFKAVKMFALDGLIDGLAKKIKVNALMAGTASSAQVSVLGFRFGKMSIPVKFALTTACGIVHKVVNDKVQPSVHEIKLPKHLMPEGIDAENYDHDFPGMNKLVKESFHYGLDHETLDYALTLLKQRIHYKADVESIEAAKDINPNESMLLLLKSGSLTPQEQNPFDLLEPTKAKWVQRAFHDYTLLRDRLMTAGGLAFGVLSRTEPRTSIYREIIDELLSSKLPSWTPGKMYPLDDNDVLGMLLERGEYTPVVEKIPHEDVLQKMGPERVRGILGNALFGQYESYRQKSKTYQFFIGYGNGKAVRFDYPLFEENGGTEIRDSVAPILLSRSSIEDEFDGTRPRIVTYAEGMSERHLIDMAKLLPSWVGGIAK